ncbi:integrase core domain-containing protein, partial [Aeromonas caviae]|uniref:integrase core domain-containing protein n=1 Tax=Aeromonas caviae TaxID=648 RepID=UPI003305E8AA
SKVFRLSRNERSHWSGNGVHVEPESVFMIGRNMQRALEQVITWRGKPAIIRCDNGPEYISEELKRWAKQEGITLGYIQPGNPQQNAYIERFNRTVRYDWLGHYLFESLNELQEFATNWLWVYNHERPNMALGGYTPKQRLAQAA